MGHTDQVSHEPLCKSLRLVNMIEFITRWTTTEFCYFYEQTLNIKICIRF